MLGEIDTSNIAATTAGPRPHGPAKTPDGCPPTRDDNAGAALLASAEARFRTLLEYSPAALFLFEDGALTFVNRAAARMFGYTPEEVIERGFAGVVHPDDLPMVREHAANRMAGKPAPVQYTVRFLAGNGDVRWGELRVGLIQLERGTAVFGTVFDVTETRTLMDAITESTALWRGLFDTYPGFIGTIDVEGKISSLNRVPPPLQVEQVIGLRSSLFVEACNKPVWEAAIERVLSTGSTEYVESTGPFRDDDGPLWYGVTLGPIMRDGQVSAVAVVSNDITVIKRNEIALRMSEERWRSLVETAPNFICIIDRDGTFLDVNRTLPGVEVIGRTTYDFLDPADHPAYSEALARVFEQGSTEQIELPSKVEGHPDMWFSLTLGPIWKNGQVVAANSVSTDTTQRKLAEEAFRASQAQLRALIETAPGFISMVDRSGVVLSVSRVNPEVAVSDVVGSTVFQWTEPEFHNELDRVLRAVFDEGGVRHVETQARFTSGERAWLQNTIGSVVQDGEVISAVIVSVDVSQRKLLETELQALREEVEVRAANRFKASNPRGLSFREIMVIDLVANGKSDRQIAETLCISPTTVAKHVANAIRKMGAANRTEAATQAVRDGII